jgi:hypothetical protein
VGTVRAVPEWGACNRERDMLLISEVPEDIAHESRTLEDD